MIYGTFPFQGPSENFIKEEILVRNPNTKPTVRPGIEVSAEVRNLIEGMLNKNPTKRLSIREILDHKWFRTNGGVRKPDEFFNKEEVELIDQFIQQYASVYDLPG